MTEADSRSGMRSPVETTHAAGTAGPKRAYVIEFVGRAGVGKTTIARRLTETLGIPGVETELLAQRPIPVPQRFQIADLILTIRLALALGLPATRETVARSFGVYKELVKLRFVKRGSGIRVFDQGLFQRLTRLAKLRPPDVKRRKAYLDVLRNAVLPDLVVYVGADPVTLVRRRATEGRGPTTPEEERAAMAAPTTVQDVRDLGNTQGVALKIVTNEHPGDVVAIADGLAADLRTSSHT